MKIELESKIAISQYKDTIIARTIRDTIELWILESQVRISQIKQQIFNN